MTCGREPRTKPKPAGLFLVRVHGLVSYRKESVGLVSNLKELVGAALDEERSNASEASVSHHLLANANSETCRE
jgi:hypothetical protein